jgi:hypothetical protein
VRRRERAPRPLEWEDLETCGRLRLVAQVVSGKPNEKLGGVQFLLGRQSGNTRGSGCGGEWIDESASSRRRATAAVESCRGICVRPTVDVETGRPNRIARRVRPTSYGLTACWAVSSLARRGAVAELAGANPRGSKPADGTAWRMTATRANGRTPAANQRLCGPRRGAYTAAGRRRILRGSPSVGLSDPRHGRPGCCVVGRRVGSGNTSDLQQFLPYGRQDLHKVSYGNLVSALCSRTFSFGPQSALQWTDTR